MIRNLINLKAVLLFISLLFLRIFLSPENVIDIISNPQKYLNKTVRVSGSVTDISSSGNSIKYHYLRGNRGGVILLYASEDFSFNKNINYNIFGIVGHNVDHNEPFIIASTVNDSNDQKSTIAGKQDITGKSIKEKTVAKNNSNFEDSISSDTTGSLLSGSSIVSFLKNSRISEFLLNQIGTQIIRIIHITCSHQSTKLINRSGDRMRFETIYKGILKKHRLVWMIELSRSTIISDFNFISDTNKFPSAKFANTIKETIIGLIKENLK